MQAGFLTRVAYPEGMPERIWRNCLVSLTLDAARPFVHLIGLPWLAITSSANLRLPLEPSSRLQSFSAWLGTIPTDQREETRRLILRVESAIESGGKVLDITVRHGRLDRWRAALSHVESQSAEWQWASACWSVWEHLLSKAQKELLDLDEQGPMSPWDAAHFQRDDSGYLTWTQLDLFEELLREQVYRQFWGMLQPRLSTAVADTLCCIAADGGPPLDLPMGLNAYQSVQEWSERPER